MDGLCKVSTSIFQGYRNTSNEGLHLDRDLFNHTVRMITLSRYYTWGENAVRENEGI